MAPKRTSTSATPTMNQAAIWQLIDDRVAAALEAQATNMENADNTNRNPKPIEAPIARKCSYKEFMSCQPFNFKGSEGTIGLIHWFERTKSMFSRSNWTKDYKVKFATEIFIRGLPISIEGNATTSKPQTLEEAINISQRLMDQVLKHNHVQETNDHKQKFDDRRNTTTNNNYPNDCDNKNHYHNHNNNNYQNNYDNNYNNPNNDHHQQQNRRKEAIIAYALNPTKNSWYARNHSLCRRCRLHHTGSCSVMCQVFNKWTQPDSMSDELVIAEMAKVRMTLKGKKTWWLRFGAGVYDSWKLQGMFKLDIEPISPRLKNNRDAHEIYIEKTIEYTDTLCGFVECARTQYPTLLESACMFTKHVQELLVYASQTCPNSRKPSEKLVAVTPINKD
nr:reverse transcriptase domain-containing protein [Tanacetum cinerariifolium]